MRYQYTRSPAFPHLRGGMPLTEISLYHGGHEITVTALIDSGAAMSVLPYDVGLELGLVWEEQNVPVELPCLPKSVYSRADSNSRVRLNLLFKKPGTDFIDSFSVYYGDWLKGEGWQVPDFRCRWHGESGFSG